MPAHNGGGICSHLRRNGPFQGIVNPKVGERGDASAEWALCDKGWEVLISLAQVTDRAKHSVQGTRLIGETVGKVGTQAGGQFPLGSMTINQAQ